MHVYGKQQVGNARLKDVARVKLGDETADFWLERRGSEDTVGRPTTEHGPHRYGVKVTARDKVDPGFLFHMVQYLWMKGYFKARAHGTTSLVNIRVDDVETIPVKL